MKGLRDILVGAASSLLGALIERIVGKPKGPTAEELRDALHVGGPTADVAERARREADERWPAPPPVPREAVTRARFKADLDRAAADGLITYAEAARALDEFDREGVN